MAKSIDSDISDLFFNTDFSECREDDGEWKMGELYETAENFADSIQRLTGIIYHKTDLVADLFTRM